MKISPRIQFLLKNGLKGLAWLAAILVLYFLFKQVVLSHASDELIAKFYAQPLIIYLIYSGSEFFFGIIPPELFMIWAINKADALHYLFNLAFFASVSYLMGYINFLIGQFFYKNETFKYLKRKILKDSAEKVKKYGLFLIIVAALTPLPWSAVSLLVGSAGYPSKRYLKYALFRFLRFAVYGYIIYQTHQI
ncbi:VTT domain-containing protein [Maribellus mangrovi]|uniref:VTT domain-containing protein n=1 Tax=Maribellus mangrovi TaxID=3133146 RepID=UPI0030EE2AA3